MSITCTNRCHFISLVVRGVFVSPLSHTTITSFVWCVFVSPLYILLSRYLSSGLRYPCQSLVHTTVTSFVWWSGVSLSVTCTYHCHYICLVVRGVCRSPCTYYCHFICLMVWCVFVSPLSLYLSSGLRCLSVPSTYHCHFICLVVWCVCQSPVHTAVTSLV